MTPRQREIKERFTAFALANRAALAKYAYLLTGSGSQVDDLVQEALTRSYLTWSRVVPGAELAYVRRVMTNLATDQWRARRFLSRFEPPERVDESWADPETAVDDRDQIVRQLVALSPRERAIVALRFYVDLSEKQVAEQLGVTVGTVKSTCHRALHKLRDRLEPATDTVGGVQ